MSNNNLTEFQRAQVESLKNVRDDAVAIMVSFGVLAEMTHAAAGIAESHIYLMLQSENPELHDIHGKLIPSAEKLLRVQRERIAQVLDDMGDWFNARDIVSVVQMEVSTPVYAVMRKRDAGETLDD